MGYSLGGEVALRAAIQHPALVRRLVLVSVAVPARRLVPGGRGRDGRDVSPEAADMMRPVAARTSCTRGSRRGRRTGRSSSPRPPTCSKVDHDWTGRGRRRDRRGRCSSSPTPTRCARTTSPSSSTCSAAACATPAGTAPPAPRAARGPARRHALRHRRLARCSSPAVVPFLELKPRISSRRLERDVELRAVADAVELDPVGVREPLGRGSGRRRTARAAAGPPCPTRPAPGRRSARRRARQPSRQRVLDQRARPPRRRRRRAAGGRAARPGCARSST